MTSFLSPTKISAGFNALEHLPFDLSAMGAGKPMVIQDSASHEAGLAKPLIKAFKASGMTIGLGSPVPEEDNTQDRAEFIRTMYNHYQDKGYDAILALGGADAADTAKALNVAVSLGPDSLNQGQVKAPLAPMVYLPSGVNAISGAAGSAFINGNSVESPFLAPDIALVDPALMRPQDRAVILDQGLSCLCIGSEVFAGSDNPPARAWAATVVSLAAAALYPLLDSGIKGPDDLKAGRKEAAASQIKLAQAAVMAGSLASGTRPLYSLIIGRAIAAKSRTPKGQIMAVVLPGILETIQARGLGELLRHLKGANGFCRVPDPQRPGTALQVLREIPHCLYAQSRGLLPRTLAEAGWQPDALAALAREISEAHGLTEEEAGTLNRILTLAWDGTPADAPKGLDAPLVQD